MAAEAKETGRSAGSIGPLVALAGVLVSAAIGFATLYNSNIQRISDAHTNFYGRAAGEEAFWRSLYEDYLEIFDERFEQKPEWRRERLLAIVELAGTREIPPFDEYEEEVAEARRTKLTQRLTRLKSSLYNGIDERAQEDPLLKAALDARGIGRDKPRDMPPIASALAAAPPPASPAISAEIALPASIRADLIAPEADRIISYSGASEAGWDLDIFWCRGPRQDVDFRRAEMLGRELGAMAEDGRAIAPGVRLGRVRTRPASVAYQRQPASPAARSWVVADASPGEAEAAAAARASANILLGHELLGMGRSGGAPTRWYLSMFLCGDAAPVPARSAGAQGGQ